MTELRATKVAVVEVYQWGRKHDWRNTIKVVFRRKYWGWWFALALTTALSAVFSSYHQEIIAAISPYKDSIRHAKWSFIIPVAVLVVISFPPLFGHELVILALGIIYGMGTGFAIACAGTFLGELACFYAFRYWFTGRAKKIEEKQVAYSCLAKMMREGGLGMIILVRFSAVPGHVTTAIQSTVGMSVWIYGIAAAFSLPKQFALVYIGVVYGHTSMPLDEWRRTHDGQPLSVYYSGSDSTSKRKRISFCVFAATTLATLIAGWVVWMRIRRIRPLVVAEMEAKRLERARDLEEIEEAKEELEQVEVVLPPNPSHWSVHARATFLAPMSPGSESMYGSQVGLLAPGRNRSGTTSTAMSSLNSPSLPHLPFGKSGDLVDYFSLEIRGPGERPAEGALGRRGSA